MNSHIPSVKSFSDCIYVFGARAARYGGRNIYIFFIFQKCISLCFCCNQIVPSCFCKIIDGP